MKKIGLLLLILFSIPAISQETEDFIGKWKVDEVLYFEVIEETGVDWELVEKVKAAFNELKLEMREDHSFKFDFAIPAMRISRGYWKYDEYAQLMSVCSWREKDAERPQNILEFYIEDCDGYEATIEIEEQFFMLSLRLEKIEEEN